MKKRKFLRSATALLLACGMIVSQAECVPVFLRVPAITAEAYYDNTVTADSLVQRDYSVMEMNNVSHEGWTAITDPSQFRGMKSGKYYLDCPGGVCSIDRVYVYDLSGDVTIDLNGQVLMAAHLQNVIEGTTITFIDSGYNKTTNRFTDLGGDNGWKYDKNGDIEVKGGCVIDYSAHDANNGHDYTLNIYGGNFISYQVYLSADKINVYGGNFLGGCRVYPCKELYMENAQIAYNSDVCIGKLVDNVKGEIKNCDIFNNFYYGLDCCSSSVLNVSGCNFSNNRYGVDSNGTAEITDCTFIDNQTALYNSYYSSCGTLTVKDSVMKNNDNISQYMGSITLDNCEASGNKSGISVWGKNLSLNKTVIRDGGGSVANVSNFSMKDSVISNIEGSGITLSKINERWSQVDGESVEISGSTISGCTGSGFVMNLNHKNINISGSTFKDNGGTGILSRHYKSAVTIDECTVTGNGDGGVYIVSDSAVVTGCNISHNKCVDSKAGGINLDTENYYIIKDCDIISNSSDNSFGGARFICGNSYEVENCRIIGNTSKVGTGGAFLRGGEGTVTDTVVRGNSGSAIRDEAAGMWLFATNVKASGLVVEDNTMTSNGYYVTSTGGINLFRSTLELDGSESPCIVTGNTHNCASKHDDVDAGIHYSSDSKLKVGGTVYVSGNIVNDGNSIKDGNVLMGGTYIGIDPEKGLSEDSLIGVYSIYDKNAECRGHKYSTVTDVADTDYTDRFTSDNGLVVNMFDDGNGSRVIMEKQHVWEDKVTPNLDETHSGKCKVCGEDDLREACHGGKADCTHKAVCEDCGEEYGKLDANAHQWGDWKSNGDGTHTRVCKLNSKHTQTEKCCGEASDCLSAGKCDICGGNMTSALGHDWGKWVSNGDGTHTRVCKRDKSHTETKKCSGGSATCLDPSVCDSCGSVISGALGHNWGEWQDNGDELVRTCKRDRSHVEKQKIEMFSISALPETSRTGSINCSAQEAKPGTVVTLEAEPAKGFRFVKWIVKKGDITINSSNTFIMPASDVEIIGVFEAAPEKHNIYAWTSSRGTGKVTASAIDAFAGEVVTLDVEPAENYRFLGWDIVSGNVDIDGMNSFIMPNEDVSIVAIMDYYPPEHYIAVWPATHRTGRVWADRQNARAGELVTLSTEPAEGYRFKGWIIEKGNVIIENNTFIMPNEDVEIAAEFEYIPVDSDISLVVRGNGTAKLSKTKAKLNDKVTLDLHSRYKDPYTDVEIIDSYGNRIPFNEEDSSFIMPSSEVTVYVRFSSTGNVGVPVATLKTDPNMDEGSSGRTFNGIGLDKIVYEIITVAEGEIVPLKMGSKTVLPKSIITNLRGQNAILELEMENGVKWRINGMDIVDNSYPMKGIDFGVQLDSKSVPSKLIPKNGTAMQFSLNHEGDFGFKAELVIPTKNYDGQDTKLYYYNPKTKELENVGSKTIEDGEVCYTFTHASDYVLVKEKYNINGDVNADGKLSVADAVLLQRALMGRSDADMKHWKAADFCEDDHLDVFDLCEMRRVLVSK